MDVGERKTVSCKVNPQAPSGSPTSSLILSPFEGFDGDEILKQLRWSSLNKLPWVWLF